MLPCSICSLKFKTTDKLEEHEWQHLQSANANAHRIEEEKIPHKSERTKSSLEKKKTTGTEVDHSYANTSIINPGYATRSKVDMTAESKKTEVKGTVEKEIGLITEVGGTQEVNKKELPIPVKKEKKKPKNEQHPEMELSNLPKCQKKAKETTCEEQDITEVSE